MTITNNDNYISINNYDLKNIIIHKNCHKNNNRNNKQNDYSGNDKHW